MLLDLFVLATLCLTPAAIGVHTVFAFIYWNVEPDEVKNLRMVQSNHERMMHEISLTKLAAETIRPIQRCRDETFKAAVCRYIDSLELFDCQNCDEPVPISTAWIAVFCDDDCRNAFMGELFGV